MNRPPVSALTRALAQFSAHCPVCRRARRDQAGLAFRVVKTFEDLCPFCRAYEKVHGRKSHEAPPPQDARNPASPA